MSCNNVIDRFDPGRLTPDDSGHEPDDPALTFIRDNGGISAEFDGEQGSFPVTCTNAGPVAVISFERIHPDRRRTKYTGLVFRTPKFVKIRGGYERTTTARVTSTGDWETEKPT